MKSKHYKKTFLYTITVSILVLLHLICTAGYAQNRALSAHNTTLSPQTTVDVPAIQQSFQAQSSIPAHKNSLLDQIPLAKLKQQEHDALAAVERFQEELLLTGSPINLSNRKHGTFQAQGSTFSFDISALPQVREIAEQTSDKENLYFRSSGLIAYNLWLENQAKVFLPSPAEQKPILIPMKSTHTYIEDLHDQHLHQLWTASLLMGMQLLGKDGFQDKAVAVAGLGSGVDTIFALQLGATRIHVLDYNTRLLDLFKSTLPYNTITTNGVVDTKNLGRSFRHLAEADPIEVDIVMANLPGLGLNFFSEFVQFFQPKSDSLQVIISGANFSMLSDIERKSLAVLQAYKKQDMVITMSYEDDSLQIKNEPVAYIFEFDKQSWESAEFLAAIQNAQQITPAAPETQAIPAPTSNRTILHSI